MYFHCLHQIPHSRNKCLLSSFTINCEKDTDPSFQKVEAPLAMFYPKMNNKDADIIGYKKSKIYTNHYTVQRLSEVLIVKNFICSRNLLRIFAFGQNQLCIIQKYDANENGMVCIHNKNLMSLY